MRSLVVLVGLAMAFGYGLVNAFASLNLYWFIAIFRPQDWIWLDISALRISLVAGVTAIVMCVLTSNWPRIQSPNGWLMLAFLALGLTAHSLLGCSKSVQWTESLFYTVVLLMLTDRMITSPRRFVIVMSVFAFALGFHASKGGMWALIQGGNQYGISNLGGSFTGSNAFALGTAVTIFFMLSTVAHLEMILGPLARNSDGSIKGWTKYAKLAGLAAIGFAAFNVMSLHSRGSFLGMAVALFVYVSVRPQGFRRLMLAIPLLFIGLIVVPLPEGFSERIESALVDRGDLDSSAASRFHYWSVAIEMANRNPAGVGLMCFNSNYNAYDTSDGAFGGNRSVHSSHLQVASETGWPGFVLWGALFVFSFLQCQMVRNRSKHLALTPEDANFLEVNAMALICGMLAFLFGGMFYAAAYMELPWLMFMLSGALNRISKDMLENGKHRKGKDIKPNDEPVKATQRKSIYTRYLGR